MHIQIFRSTVNKNWYFRFVARNGKVVAQSEGYSRRGAAVRMAKRIANLGWGAWVEEVK